MDNPMPFFDNPYESVVERRIREAMDRGEFDDLPGTGEPFPDAGQPYHELWWVERWLKRNEPTDQSSPSGRRGEQSKSRGFSPPSQPHADGPSGSASSR